MTTPTCAAPGDTYAAVRTIRPGETYAGTVRHIHKGEIRRCAHAHRTRSTALECGERLTP